MAASAAVTTLSLLGPVGAASAKTNTTTPAPKASVTTQAPMPDAKQAAKDALIKEAMAAGLITQADLVAPPPGAILSPQANPTVTTVTPNGGPLKGGQIVVIVGTNFTGASDVSFGSTAATTYAVVNATKVVAKVPDASAAGAQVVKVTNADGQNTTGASYTYGAPTVSSVTPNFADPTASKVITITGTGFLGAVAGDVLFGTLAATDIWVVSDTQIVVTTPKDTTGNNAVTVTRGIGDVTVTRNSVASATGANSKFLFSPGAPTVTQLGATGSQVFSTSDVAINALMTITGTQLWGVNKVNFGSTAVTASADIVVASDGNTLTVKVPTRTAGPVDVTVENVIGASTTNLKTRFSYLATVAPTVTSVTPNVLDKTANTGGGTVLIVGAGFTGAGTSQVTLKCTADVSASKVVVVSDTNMIATFPGNGGTAETCPLEIQNPADNTKKGTLTGAVRYV